MTTKTQPRVLVAISADWEMATFPIASESPRRIELVGIPAKFVVQRDGEVVTRGDWDWRSAMASAPLVASLTADGVAVLKARLDDIRPAMQGIGAKLVRRTDPPPTAIGCLADVVADLTRHAQGMARDRERQAEAAEAEAKRWRRYEAALNQAAERLKGDGHV